MGLSVGRFLPVPACPVSELDFQDFVQFLQSSKKKKGKNFPGYLITEKSFKFATSCTLMFNTLQRKTMRSKIKNNFWNTKSLVR